MKRLIDRIRHMLRVKDCRHICLFCEFFDRCKEEYEAETAGGSESGEKRRFRKIYRGKSDNNLV